MLSGAGYADWYYQDGSILEVRFLMGETPMPKVAMNSGAALDLLRRLTVRETLDFLRSSTSLEMGDPPEYELFGVSSSQLADLGQSLLCPVSEHV